MGEKRTPGYGDFYDPEDVYKPWHTTGEINYSRICSNLGVPDFQGSGCIEQGIGLGIMMYLLDVSSMRGF